MISVIAEAFQQAVQAGDIDHALSLAEARVGRVGNDAGAWHLLGHALDAKDRRDDADAAFATAHRLQPALIRYRFSLGGNCFQQRQWTRAAHHFQACVAAQPGWLDAWMNLARARLKTGAHGAALAAAARAALLAPAAVEPVKLQAICAELANAPANDILAIRMRIAGLQPDDAEAQFLLAMAHWSLRDHAHTHQHLERCLRIDPDYFSARWAKAQLPRQSQFLDQQERRQFLQQWRSDLAEIAALPLESPALHAHCEAVMQMHTNFHLAYLGEPFRAEQQRYGAVVERMAQAVCADLQVVRRPIQRARRRIGVISGMMHRHSVTKLFMPAFLALDRSRFEVIGFGLRDVRDDWTTRYERELDGFYQGAATPRQWAQRIAACDLDVLVHLDVGMFGLASSLAALRLAPVQAVLWGHPITTGLRTMDWFLSSAAMEPADHASHYTERVLALPGIGCVFEPPDFTPDPAMLQRLGASSAVRAACLQNAEKLSPAHDALFAELLARVPGLHLSFVPGLLDGALPTFRQRLRRACAARGVDADTRVSVHGRLSQEEFAAVTASQDFVLDSMEWSGGVTALETFWFDKPILTLPGALMRGRHTAAMLARMDLPELIASDTNDYLERAVRLASDAGWRDGLAAQVSQRKSVLYRDPLAQAALSDWLASVQVD